MVDTKDDTESVIQTIVEMDRELGEATFKSQIQLTTEREDLFAPLSKANVPVHFLYSRDDLLVNREWIQRFVETSTTASATEIDGRGHMLPLERPQVLFEQISRLLEA